MRAFFGWDWSAGTASISSAAPEPVDIAAVSWRLTKKQNQLVRTRSADDARAFGVTRGWSVAQREDYLAALERILAGIEDGEEGGGAEGPGTDS